MSLTAADVRSASRRFGHSILRIASTYVRSGPSLLPICPTSHPPLSHLPLSHRPLPSPRRVASACRLGDRLGVSLLGVSPQRVVASASPCGVTPPRLRGVLRSFAPRDLRWVGPRAPRHPCAGVGASSEQIAVGSLTSCLPLPACRRRGRRASTRTLCVALTRHACGVCRLSARSRGALSPGRALPRCRTGRTPPAAPPRVLKGSRGCSKRERVPRRSQCLCSPSPLAPVVHRLSLQRSRVLPSQDQHADRGEAPSTTRV